MFGCPPCLVLTCENKVSAKETAWPSLVCFGTDFTCSGWDPSQERVGESPSLEIFKTRLDKVLCSLLWVTLLRQGVGLGDPQRALPTPTII